MVLFSILKQDTAAVSSGTTSNGNSSRALPTIVQLYRTAPAFTANNASSPPPYAWWTYQAVATTEIGNEATASGPSLRKQAPSAANTSAPPDLGVWNCRVRNNNNNASETLWRSNKDLKQVNNFVWTVDMEPAASVEPALTALQNALIRHLVERSAAAKDEEEPAPLPPPVDTATTSLAKLRNTQFGLANNDNSYTAPPVPANSQIDEQNVKVALMIVIRLNKANKNNSTDEYMAQQHQALLVYHLRKFAVAISAPLVFVQDDTDMNASAAALQAPNTATSVTACLTPAQLAVLWRAWAQGAPVWRETLQYLEEAGLTLQMTDPEANDDKTAGEENPASTDTAASNNITPTALYSPDPDDLIETVLLRAANYPGHWEASKDSIWHVLPAVSASSGSREQSGNKQNNMAADQGWLEELRQSVATASSAAGLTTPEPKKKSSSNTPAKTPNEAAAFFESLLK